MRRSRRKPVSAFPIRLRVTERGDGGVRVRSDDVPGLLATGRDAKVLWGQLPDMIRGLLSTNRGIELTSLDLGSPPIVGAGESVDVSVTGSRSG